MPDSIGGVRPVSQSIKLDSRERAATGAYKRKKNCNC